jgi:hypothetical protein
VIASEELPLSECFSEVRRLLHITSHGCHVGYSAHCIPPSTLSAVHSFSSLLHIFDLCSLLTAFYNSPLFCVCS